MASLLLAYPKVCGTDSMNRGRFIVAPTLDAKALADALTTDSIRPTEAPTEGIGVSTRSASGVAQMALRKIVPLLWQSGAKSVSYCQMSDVTGLTRTEILRMWPSKLVLLRSAIDLYREAELALQLSILDRGGKNGLVDFWSREESRLERAGARGCFLFRTANGEYGRDVVIASVFEDYIGQLHNRIVRDINDGQRVGEIGRSMDPVVAGWQCVSILSLVSALTSGSRHHDRRVSLFAAARHSCGL